ncbi:MAG: hypothetical protein M1827_004175 [Pycnora praestabilis]|nr:MAG: hypothetical protein M1827_004175 [Pycnora praestabilis]
MAPSRISPPSPPSSTGTDSSEGLSKEQLHFYRENGYLLIPNALDSSTVSSLLGETKQMLEDFSLDDHPMTKFSTGEGDEKHVGDDYFLTSGDKVRFFFEEAPNPMRRARPTNLIPKPADAFAPDGTLLKSKSHSINKIGHYLHALLPSFQHSTLNTQNASIARSLSFRDPRVLQSMIICKQPEIGGRVPPHQDSTFLYTDPPSAVGFWYALEDATEGNGCLSFAKGSHKMTEVGKRFVRGEEEGTGFVDVEGGRFPAGETGKDGRGTAGGEEVYTVGEVKAGTLVLIHGNLLHKSERNLSGKSRFIYTFHVIEGENVYDERNWLQPPEKGFSRLYGKREL